MKKPKPRQRCTDCRRLLLPEDVRALTRHEAAAVVLRRAAALITAPADHPRFEALYQHLDDAMREFYVSKLATPEAP